MPGRKKNSELRIYELSSFPDSEGGESDGAGSTGGAIDSVCVGGGTSGIVTLGAGSTNFFFGFTFFFLTVSFAFFFALFFALRLTKHAHRPIVEPLTIIILR